MCGIAGLIHKGKTVNIGKELQDMLQALKHRGPDSTGFALYGQGNNQGDYIMRFKVGENVAEGSSAVNEEKSVYDARRKEVDKHIRDLGGSIVNDAQLTPYSFSYRFCVAAQVLGCFLGICAAESAAWFLIISILYPRSLLALLL